MTLLVAGSFVWLLWKRRKIPIARLLLAVLFGYLGWQARKNMAFFAVAGLALTLWNVDDCDVAKLNFPARTRNVPAWLSLALLLLLVASVPSNLCFDFLQRAKPAASCWKFGFGEMAGLSPHAEAEFLGRPGMPQRIFAFDHPMVSACIFHLGPDRKVFVDGRLEVSTRENYERFFEIADLFPAHDPAMEEKLLAGVAPDAAGKREMPALLLDWNWFAGAVERLVDHPRWRPVFYGGTGIVFLYEPDAQRLGIPAVDRERLRIDLLRRVLQDHPRWANTHFQLGDALCRSDAAEAAQHFRRAWQIKPDFAEAHCRFAMLIAATAPEMAQEHYRLAIHYDPRNAGAFFNYANLLLQSGRYSDAIDLYRQALRINPKLDLARRNEATAEDRLKQESETGRP